MAFHVGEAVIHCTYGFGHVVEIDDRIISDQTTVCYAVSIRDLTVWVPSDAQLESRLRVPTPGEEFPELFAILTGKSEPLPDDRQDRRNRLVQTIKDGKAASHCRVLRELADYKQSHSLNDSDQTIMKRAREALLSEWVHALSVPIAEAEAELHSMLTTGLRVNANQA